MGTNGFQMEISGISDEKKRPLTTQSRKASRYIGLQYRKCKGFVRLCCVRANSDQVDQCSGRECPACCLWNRLAARELREQPSMRPYAVMEARFLEFFIRAVHLVVVQPKTHQQRINPQDRP